jgi:hypothetical protein
MQERIPFFIVGSLTVMERTTDDRHVLSTRPSAAGRTANVKLCVLSEGWVLSGSQMKRSKQTHEAGRLAAI